jgi:hypothetical protein
LRLRKEPRFQRQHAAGEPAEPAHAAANEKQAFQDPWVVDHLDAEQRWARRAGRRAGEGSIQSAVGQSGVSQLVRNSQMPTTARHGREGAEAGNLEVSDVRRSSGSMSGRQQQSSPCNRIGRPDMTFVHQTDQ